MYVCICNGFRDSEIRSAALAGKRYAQTAYNALGGAPRCGRCLDFAQRLIDEIHAHPDGRAMATVSAGG